ncbi:MAG: type II secretion system protein N [Steroidobacteraceae bacterium]|nr:type II secretion system protein N [Steroidobacteraceae bacterium]
MKRGRLALLLVAGLFVFGTVLIAYLPASWVVMRLPAELQFQCADVGGSIFEGECLGASLRGKRLGDATWNLKRLEILRGRLVGDLDLRGALNARADLDVSFAGSGELRNLTANFPLDPAVLPAAPVDQRATIVLDLKRVVLETRAPRTIEGSLELQNLRQVGARPLELGSYRAEFDGKAQPDGNSLGQLRDLGGPFEMVGAVTLTPPNGYLVQGTIAGRTAQAESLVREITIGAPPDTSGRTPFSFEGSY